MMKIPKIPTKKDMVKGGEIVSRILAAEGVNTIFGIIDGSYFGFYSTLAPNGIRMVTPRHESDAVHMAAAYARLTGKLGVCMASNGPGAANVLPGVALEHAEGNRVLLITSTRREGISYPDRGGTFQYFSQVDVTRPMSKWCGNVTSVNRIAEFVQTAIRKSRMGRPGIVHIDVPENIMSTGYEVNPAWFRSPDSYQASDPFPAVPQQVEQAAQMLANAHSPVIYAGSGVIHSRAFGELQRLAELLNAPVTTSPGARCAVDERLKQVVPVIYKSLADQILQDADVILVLGADFEGVGGRLASGRGEPVCSPAFSEPACSPNEGQKIIQVDPDAEMLGSGGTFNLAVHADLKPFMTALLDSLHLKKPFNNADGREKKIVSHRKAIKTVRAKMDERLAEKRVSMDPALVPVICQEVFDDDAIMVIDGGMTAAWCHYYHRVERPNTLLDMAKTGHVGAGAARAVGAKAACPKRQVYAVMGDGAMCSNQREIETCIRTNLPVVFIVVCDDQMSEIKPAPFSFLNGQDINAWPRKQKWNTQFDLIAKSMGALGERVSDPAGLKTALKRAVEAEKCSVIQVNVDSKKIGMLPEV